MYRRKVPAELIAKPIKSLPDGEYYVPHEAIVIDPSYNMVINSTMSYIDPPKKNSGTQWAKIEIRDNKTKIVLLDSSGPFCVDPFYGFRKDMFGLIPVWFFVEESPAKEVVSEVPAE